MLDQIKITTRSKLLKLSEFCEADVDIQDVAHSLSQQCRYNGGTPRFYSVGEHSPLVARLTKWLIQTVAFPFIEQWTGDDKAMCVLGAVCHDNPEYITGDLVRPIKRAVEGFREIEDFITPIMERAVGLNLTPEMRQVIKQADDGLADLELRWFFPWKQLGPPTMSFTIQDLHGAVKPGMPVRKAKKFFLDSFHKAAAGEWEMI